MDKKISEKVINRLTLYHCILSDYITANIEFISSKQIAQLLKIDDSQVRKDINLLNNSGKCRVGYIVKELKASIEKTLGFKKTKKAFIIGAGNLGSALANYDNFTDYGLNIISLFDNDKANIGDVDSKVDDEEVKDVIKDIQFNTSNPNGITMVMFKYDGSNKTVSIPVASTSSAGIITSKDFLDFVKQHQL